MQPRPKIIFIDWDQTLNHFRFWGHWRTTRPADFDIIQQQLFGPSQRDRIHAWMRGQLTSEDICGWLESEHGWPASRLMRELQQSCQSEGFTDPSVANLIARLRTRGSRIVIATDNMDTFNRWTIPAMDLSAHFDAILNSFDLGALKSDVADNGRWPFFDQFMKNQGVSYKDCVLIDDSTNLEPIANQFGLPYRRVAEHQLLGDHLTALLD